jgi:hypothetical protein
MKNESYLVLEKKRNSMFEINNSENSRIHLKSEHFDNSRE